MTRRRSTLAGFTDYTGVSFEDVLEHLRDWRDGTGETIKTLKDCLWQVEADVNAIDSPNAVRDYLLFFIDLFERYLSDFDRLVLELPLGAQERHLETLKQIYDSSQLHEEICIRFSSEYINNRSLKDERKRGLLDRIYRESRDQIIDYRDLSNVYLRLKTFVGNQSFGVRASSGTQDIIEMKPGVAGFSIDIRELFRRLTRWVRR